MKFSSGLVSLLLLSNMLEVVWAHPREEVPIGAWTKANGTEGSANKKQKVSVDHDAVAENISKNPENEENI